MTDRRSINFSPIGYIRTPFTEKKGTPIQPCYSTQEGKIELLPEYTEGLRDLDEFSHVILLYHFHKADTVKLTLTPFLHDEERGVFATRAPLRPNPIGLSIVELITIDYNKNTIHVRGVDMLDKTPLLDIKPYIPVFDHRKAKVADWILKRAFKDKKITSDGRF